MIYSTTYHGSIGLPKSSCSRGIRAEPCAYPEIAPKRYSSLDDSKTLDAKNKNTKPYKTNEDMINSCWDDTDFQISQNFTTKNPWRFFQRDRSSQDLSGLPRLGAEPRAGASHPPFGPRSRHLAVPRHGKHGNLQFFDEFEGCMGHGILICLM